MMGSYTVAVLWRAVLHTPLVVSKLFAVEEVLWSPFAPFSGAMFLPPQHFQQQDCYHEARLRRYLHWLAPFAWGIKSLVIRESALQSFVCDIERGWTTRAREPEGRKHEAAWSNHESSGNRGDTVGFGVSLVAGSPRGQIY
jgi:hypothetical protein